MEHTTEINRKRQNMANKDKENKKIFDKIRHNKTEKYCILFQKSKGALKMEKFAIKCTNGLLKVYEDKAIISRNTAMGFVTQGLKGDKVFFYNTLSSIEYKKPSFFANGYIKFITAGTQERNQNIGLLGNTTIEASKDPNTLILRAFNKEIPSKSEQIYMYILKRISEIKKENSTINNISNADEIMRFKQLLDEGIISQEEFEKKKQELLK